MKKLPRSVMLGLSIQLALACVACVACGANEPREQEQVVLVADSEQIQGAGTVYSDQQELAALAINTLAAHLSVEPGEITLQSLSPVDWPDSSLGCPQPGMSYLQVITPGHKALLQHRGKTYEVHMAGSRAFVCVNKGADGAEAAKMPVPRLSLTSEHAGRLAAADLARRLGVDARLVTVVSTRPVVWTDRSLGCPSAGGKYETTQIKGQIVELEFKNRRYEYHSGLDQLIPCPPIEAE